MLRNKGIVVERTLVTQSPRSCYNSYFPRLKTWQRLETWRDGIKLVARGEDSIGSTDLFCIFLQLILCRASLRRRACRWTASLV